MTTYEIRPDSADTYALRNRFTGQFDHGGFISVDRARKFFHLHFGWNPAFRLI